MSFILNNLDQTVNLNAGSLVALSLTSVILLYSVIHQGRLMYRSIKRGQNPYGASDPYEMSYRGDDNRQVSKVYPQRRHNYFEVAYAAFYQYQYKPIPMLNDSTVGELLEMILYILLHAIVLFAPGSLFGFPDGDPLTNVYQNRVLANRFGYAAIGNSAFVLITGTRNNILTALMGIPFERIILYHRWCGRMIFYLVTGHMTVYISIWNLSTGIATNLGPKYIYNRYGLASWFFLLVIMITAYSLVRRKAFEWFYYLHFAFFGYYAFGLLHLATVPGSNDSFLHATAVGMVFYFIDRFIRFWRSNISVARCIDFKYLGAGCVRVTFIKANFSYHSGQYVFICFPDYSQIKWHPFTISSAPNERNGGKQPVTLHIKDIGDFTKKIVAAAQNSSFNSGGYDNNNNSFGGEPGSYTQIDMPQGSSIPIRVRVDGPYGLTGVDFLDHPVAVLIGGGIGVTPMISEVTTLARRMKEGTSHALRSVYLIWSIPTEDQYEWFSYEFHELDQYASNKADINVIVYVTRQKQVSSDFFITERPNYRKLFSAIQAAHKCDAAVAVCGPKAMVLDVRNAAAGVSHSGSIFHFHEEVFAF